MIDAVAEDVVHLDRVRSAAVDQRSRPYSGPATEGQAGVAVVEFLRKTFFEKSRGRNNGTRQQCSVPVDHGALGVVQHFGRNGSAAVFLGPAGKPLYDVHGAQFL